MIRFAVQIVDTSCIQYTQNIYYTGPEHWSGTEIKFMMSVLKSKLNW